MIPALAKSHPGESFWPAPGRYIFAKMEGG